MAILQFDKGATSLMKVIALTIFLLMLPLIAFGERAFANEVASRNVS
jgi:hypothetical protein